MRVVAARCEEEIVWRLHLVDEAACDGVLKQCVIDPAGASKLYPDDCTLDLTGFTMSTAPPNSTSFQPRLMGVRMQTRRRAHADAAV